MTDEVYHESSAASWSLYAPHSALYIGPQMGQALWTFQIPGYLSWIPPQLQQSLLKGSWTMYVAPKNNSHYVPQGSKCCGKNYLPQWQGAYASREALVGVIEVWTPISHLQFACVLSHLFCLTTNNNTHLDAFDVPEFRRNNDQNYE